jgi:hypothetical protein
MPDSDKEPPNFPRLPPGVGFSVQYPDGTMVHHIDPFLRDMRWPDITVDSSAFKNLPAHDRL